MQRVSSPNSGKIGPSILRPFKDISPSVEGLTAQPHIFRGGPVDTEHNPKSPMV